MSLSYSPKVVTDGLVLYYDMSNTKKSWKGAPVTNLQWNGGSEYAPWTSGGINTDVTGTSHAGPVKNSKTWRFEKTGSSSQWNGWEGTYGNNWTGNSGDIWSLSYWYKTTAAAGVTWFNAGQFARNDWSVYYNTTFLTDSNSIVADGQWHYNYGVIRINEAYTNAIIVDGPAWGYSSSAGVLYINGIQWNKNAYAAPFSEGTRSNTQAILDLTGLNTLTATSLTYASDNTFSFVAGSSNTLNLGNTSYSQFPHNSPWTIQIVAKLTAVNTYPGILYRGNSVTTGVLLYYDDGTKTLFWKHNNAQFGVCTYTSGQVFVLTITYNGASNMTTYKNGVCYTGSGAMASTDISSDTLLGRGDEYGTSTIYSFMKYNKALSATEVLQNFNAIRGIYSL